MIPRVPEESAQSTVLKGHGLGFGFRGLGFRLGFRVQSYPTSRRVYKSVQKGLGFRARDACCKKGLE